MTPSDVKTFLHTLAESGLTVADNNGWLDVAVVDQMTGPTATADWLQFAHLPFGETDGKVGACWLLSGAKFGHGIHVPALRLTLAIPKGWIYETSLSADPQFLQTEKMAAGLQFLRHENGSDVYLDRSTGQEVFVGRASGAPT